MRGSFFRMSFRLLMRMLIRRWTFRGTGGAPRKCLVNQILYLTFELVRLLTIAPLLVILVIWVVVWIGNSVIIVQSDLGGDDSRGSSSSGPAGSAVTRRVMSEMMVCWDIVCGEGNKKVQS